MIYELLRALGHSELCLEMGHELGVSTSGKAVYQFLQKVKIEEDILTFDRGAVV